MRGQRRGAARRGEQRAERGALRGGAGRSVRVAEAGKRLLEPRERKHEAGVAGDASGGGEAGNLRDGRPKKPPRDLEDVQRRGEIGSAADRAGRSGGNLRAGRGGSERKE